MIVLIEDIPKDVALNNWHRVYAIDGERKERLYVQFKRAEDLQGNSLDRLVQGMTVVAEVSYIDSGYP